MLASLQIGTAATFKYVFDYKPDDIYWCTADCGWITGEEAGARGGGGGPGLVLGCWEGRAPPQAAQGESEPGSCPCEQRRDTRHVPTSPPIPPAGHSYVTFGPLLMGAKQILFEGVPTYPDAGRCWEVRSVGCACVPSKACAPAPGPLACLLCLQPPPGRL